MLLLTRTLTAFAAVAVLPVWAAEVQQPLYPQKHHKTQPLIGFGTWNLNSPENTTSAVSLAIQVGYRQIDCAAAYKNEREVGTGIADGLEKAGLTRDQIWVTSKLWNDQYVNCYSAKYLDIS